MKTRPTQPSRQPPVAPWLPELLHLHGPRILVVEDDRELEPLVRRAASFLGPTVQIDWCTSTKQAHTLLSMRFYDAVLADWRLDGAQSGLALRVDCWNLQPQAVFAMTSSYPLSSYLHSVGRPGIPFLAKPYDLLRCSEFLSSLLVGEQGADS
jgi:DNA-binding NtrC family response regulator